MKSIAYIYSYLFPLSLSFGKVNDFVYKNVIGATALYW